MEKLSLIELTLNIISNYDHRPSSTKSKIEDFKESNILEFCPDVLTHIPILPINPGFIEYTEWNFY